MADPNPECSALYRHHDWSSSPLGATDSWPVELRTLVNVMLGSLQPMLIVWGPEQTTLYNDGYAAMCGQRHPAAFGKPFRDLWFEIWDQVDPIISAAYAGQGTSMDDIEFTMLRNGYPEETHFAFSYTPVRNQAGEVLGMFCACSETTTEVRSRRAEKLQKERFIQVFELSQGGIAMLVGPNHVFDYANAEYYRIVGADRDIIGRPVSDAVSEVVRQGFIELLDNVYRTGEPYIARNLPIDLNRGPDGEKQSRVIDLVYQPIRNDSDEITGILVQARDVTNVVAEEERREALARELGHRLKNQLMMVRAIASQTLRSATDIETARKILSDRLSVLGTAHDAVLHGDVGASDMVQVTRELRKLHDGGQMDPKIVCVGPALRVGPRANLSLSLILHELATNSLKHGALSVPDGRVHLTWSVDQDKTVQISWQEYDGPKVAVPSREGTGTRLIKAGLSGCSRCDVDLQYLRDGLQCTITADLEGFQRNG